MHGHFIFPTNEETHVGGAGVNSPIKTHPAHVHGNEVVGVLD